MTLGNYITTIVNLLAQGAVEDGPTPWAWWFGQGVLGVMFLMFALAVIHVWRTFGLKFLQAQLDILQAIPADLRKREDLEERHVKSCELQAVSNQQTSLAMQTIAMVMAAKSVKTLLFIEDDYVQAKPIMSRLDRIARANGFTLMWKENLAGARLAWDAADVIIADLTLEDAGFRQMIDFLSVDKTKPIIFYTSNTDPAVLAECAEIGKVVGKADGPAALFEAVKVQLQDFKVDK